MTTNQEMFAVGARVSLSFRLWCEQNLVPAFAAAYALGENLDEVASATEESLNGCLSAYVRQIVVAAETMPDDRPLAEVVQLRPPNAAAQSDAGPPEDGPASSSPR